MDRPGRRTPTQRHRTRRKLASSPPTTTARPQSSTSQDSSTSQATHPPNFAVWKGCEDTTTPCPCDFNDNGVQEIGDYFSFLTAFFAQLGGTGSADFDNDGTVTIGDYFAFLACLPSISTSEICN